MAERDNNILKLASIIAGLEQEHVEAEAFFDMAYDLLCVADLTTSMFIRLNPQWYRVTGWTIQELMSKPWLEFIHPDDVEQTINAGQYVRNGKPLMNFKNRYICKDGSLVALEWTAQADPVSGLSYAVARVVDEDA